MDIKEGHHRVRLQKARIRIYEYNLRLYSPSILSGIKDLSSRRNKTTISFSSVFYLPILSKHSFIQPDCALLRSHCRVKLESSFRGPFTHLYIHTASSNYLFARESAEEFF